MIDRLLTSCAKAKAVVPPMLGLALPRRFATDRQRGETSGLGKGQPLDAGQAQKVTLDL